MGIDEVALLKGYGHSVNFQLLLVRAESVLIARLLIPNIVANLRPRWTTASPTTVRTTDIILN